METKICKGCGRELPMEKFVKASRGKYGRASKCRDCFRQYREANKEHITKHKKEYSEANKEAISRHKKEYVEANKVSIAGKQKMYYEENRDRILAHMKLNRKQFSARKKRWVEANIERVLKNRKKYNILRKDIMIEYRQINKEAIHKYSKEYSREHLVERCVLAEKRRARKRLLPATLTAEQWEKIKKAFDGKCAYCGEEKPLQQEHFVALSKGGEYTHNNIIPSCQSCNCSKNDKSFFDWYPRFKRYSKKRETTILKFLNYKKGIQQLALM